MSLRVVLALSLSNLCSGLCYGSAPGTTPQGWLETEQTSPIFSLPQSAWLGIHGGSG